MKTIEVVWVEGENAAGFGHKGLIASARGCEMSVTPAPYPDEPGIARHIVGWHGFTVAQVKGGRQSRHSFAPTLEEAKEGAMAIAGDWLGVRVVERAQLAL